jgi:hypothetical protein
VRCVTRDDYIRARRIDTVRLIKVDVEGAELPALRGLVDAMAEGIVSLIYLESHPFHLRHRVVSRQMSRDSADLEVMNCSDCAVSACCRSMKALLSTSCGMYSQ